MTTLEELLSDVEHHFAQRSPDLTLWPDPHPAGVSPAEEEYSRVTHPERYRILGARADAWLAALVRHGLATTRSVDPPDLRWEVPPRTVMSSAVVASPVAEGAAQLVVVRCAIDGIEDTGISLGFADPTIWVGAFPDCGCDACDNGAQHDLDTLDEHLTSMVTGQFRRLVRKKEQITLLGDGTWSAASTRSPEKLAAVVANPTGWRDVGGAPWLGSAAQGGDN